jgi:hypothetical protein
VSDWNRQPQAYRRIDAKNVHLLCCHCGHAALFIYGQGAPEFAADLTGRVICEECARLRVEERQWFRNATEERQG